jgi:hypothetical protein
MGHQEDAGEAKRFAPPLQKNSEFGCSTYARKEDEIYFPMKLVSCPTKIRFNQNCQNKFNF